MECMTVHLIKLSVGPESLTQLAEWQQQRLKDKKRAKEKPRTHPYHAAQTET